MTMRRAVVVMGVSGSGKSSVGAALAKNLALPFVDADSLHPPENVARMAAGQPLTDEDRWPWLARVAAHLGDRVTYPEGVVIACSALRRTYRDHIRTGACHAIAFVLLDISRETAQARLLARRDHFMPVALIESQFATLERPSPDEADVTTIVVGSDVDGTARQAWIALNHGTSDKRVRQETSR